MDNPKGLMQVLWELKFMDTSKDICSYYTLRGQEDNNGNKIVDMSLKELMQTCLNFIEEEKLLQTNDCKVGECRDNILVDCTPHGPPRYFL